MNYEKPPIVEAVVQFSFENEMKLPDLNRISEKFEKKYPIKSNRQQISTQYDSAQGTAKNDISVLGYELSTNDALERVRIETTYFLAIQLAPYPGWEDFSNRIAKDWDTWRKVVGVTALKRVGVRFINRIDIPFQDAPVLEQTDYITVFPNIPAFETNVITGFTMQVLIPADKTGIAARITSATTDSPVPEHLALFLDIDVFKDQGIPSKTNELKELLDHFRVAKNYYFEKCITDQTRKLFSK